MNVVSLSNYENSIGRLERLMRVLKIISIYGSGGPHGGPKAENLLDCITHLHDHKGTLTVTVNSDLMPPHIGVSSVERARLLSELQRIVRAAWMCECEPEECVEFEVSGWAGNADPVGANGAD